jgi:predicted amidohydrolase
LKTVQLGLAQISSKIGNVQANERRHIETLGKLNEESPDFVCFPELSLTGYLMKDLAYEVVPQCQRALSKIAKKSKIGQRVIVGLVKQNNLSFIENSAAIVGDGRMIGTTSKFYLPTYGLFEERRYFVPGNPQTDLKVFESPVCKFGVIICEDAWHPEPIEALARLGAEVVFCIASSPARGLTKPNSSNELQIESQWISILKAHAIMNTIFVAFVNRSGPEDEECFWGGSTIVSPFGEIVARASKFESDVLLAKIDLDEIARARRFTSFRDHNSKMHAMLEEL